jgi:hypothetical protein
MTTPNVSPALQVPATIDYTSKDYSGFLSSMLQYAGQVAPQWNTASEGDMGVALLELYAYVADILSFYGDRITQEAYLPTATQRLSLINIAALLGYPVSNGSAATGTVTFATATTATSSVEVPPGTQVASNYMTTTDSPIIYEVNYGQANYMVPANGVLTLNVTQGVTYTQIPIGVSTGLPGQVFQIPQTGVIDGTVSVYVQTATSPQQWTFIQYLVDAAASDIVFTTYTDSNGVTWVQFGDGVNGLIPAQGMQVYATYRIGVGSQGNVAEGVVGELVTPLTNVAVAYQADGVSFESSQMSGGADPETNDQIRANAPAIFATQQRAVSLADFQAMAVNVPGVSVASAVAQHSTSVSIYALGPDYQPAQAGLQADIIDYFDGKTMAGVTVNVAQPTLVAIDVGSSSSPVTVQVQPNYIMSTVLQNIETALTALFQPPNVSFGQYITVGLVYQTIMKVAGVAWCVVPVITREDYPQTTANPIQLRGSEVPTPGNYSNMTAQGGI